MSSQDEMTVFPFKPGDWVTDGFGHVAKVKGVREGAPGETLLDLWLYSRQGDRVGRESPSMGGPRTYEPACSSEGWLRIAKPDFPLELKWVPNDNGTVSAGYYAGKPLPPANWTPPKRKAGATSPFLRALERLPKDDPFRKTLEAIADGHNDPRRLAATALGRLEQ